MKPLKQKISITIDSNILETISELAEKDERNLSQYINLILKNWISNQDNDNPSSNQNK